jgi:hypothetical protein
MSNMGAIPAGQIIALDALVTAPVAGNTFQFQAADARCDFSALFQATGTLTTLVGDLQVSLDGGTTWTIVQASVVSAATPVSRVVVVAGALYRINYGTASGSINVRVTSN